MELFAKPTECPVCGAADSGCSFLKDEHLIIRAADLRRKEEVLVSEHRSKERVFEPDDQGVPRLKYAEGDPIPEDEARRQGLLDEEKAVEPAEDKAERDAEDKAARPRRGRKE